MRDIRLIICAAAAGGMLAAGLALSACDQQGSAEKAGKEAGKRIDQEVEQTKDAVDKAKENAARLLQEVGQKAKDAADQARQGARTIVEEAEHNTEKLKETPKQ